MPRYLIDIAGDMNVELVEGNYRSVPISIENFKKYGLPTYTYTYLAGSTTNYQHPATFLVPSTTITKH